MNCSCRLFFRFRFRFCFRFRQEEVIAEESARLGVVVEIITDYGFIARDPEIDVTAADGLHVRNGKELLGVVIFREIDFEVLRLAGHYKLVESRSGHYESIAEQVAGEIAINFCAVVEFYLVSDDYCSAIFTTLRDNETWTEEEEGDVARTVPSANLSKDGKRWVVDDNSILRVFGILIVATWIEGAQYLLIAEVVDLADVFQYRLINVLWSIGVVGGLLALRELSDIAFVIVEDDRVTAAPSSLRALNGRGEVFMWE